MTTKSSAPKSLFENLEKILIAFIFVSIIVLFIATGEKELKSGYAFPIVLSLEILLCGYYLYLSRNLYSLFLAGFILLNLGHLFSSPIGTTLIITGKVSLFALGIFLGYKTVKESIRNKDWELFGTLITLALLFPLVHHFYFQSNEDYLMVYNFALAFMLGTIMYNENLWDKYNVFEKKILTYVLVCSVAEVLFISVKLL